MTLDTIMVIIAVTAMFATLACISNPVGGDWIGNARWTGVPLAHVLKLAEPLTRAAFVVFHCLDSRAEGLCVRGALCGRETRRGGPCARPRT